jgi:uncharacterized protein
MMLRRALARLAAAIAILLFVPQARAQDEAVIPAYQGYVTDAAGVLGDETRAKLEAFLDQVQQKTGAQFAVLTVKTTAPLEPSDYKTRVFDRWKIGQKGKDNGLLLLIAMDEHKIEFETGYGLEGVLPDGLEARIVRQLMAPAMRQNDVDGAVVAGVQAAAARIAADQHVTLTWDGRELRYGGDLSERGGIPPVWLAFIVLIIVMHVLRSIFFRRRGWWWMGPGGMGGWGGGFGGFGGGGGGGGSFGGFGGGSSGGGGGGGSW